MKSFKKIIASKLFQNHTGTILFSLYLAMILGACSLSLAISSESSLFSAEPDSIETAEQNTEANPEGDKSEEKDSSEESEPQSADSNDDERSHNNLSSSKPAPKPEANQSSGPNTEAEQRPEPKPETDQGSAPKPNRVWIEPVYETVEHPAVTKQRKHLSGVTCACGQYFSNDNNSATGDWQAHRPVPCDGKHVYYTSHYEIRTIVVQEAWTEQVLVKEGYWKEG